MADNTQGGGFPWAGAVSGALGIGLGQIFRGQQMQDNRRLMEMQLRNQMRLNEQGHQMQKDMWDYTNYKNQAEHIKNAGLNVGLMYGSAGQGGQTGSQGGGSATGGSLPNGQNMSMEVGMQLQQQQAQNDLMKAQTKKLEAETRKVEGVDTQLAQTQIDGNTIANRFNNENFDTALQKSKAELDNVIANTEKQVAEGNLSKIDAATRNWKNTSEVLNTIMETKKMSEGIKQDWAKVKQGWKDLELKNKGLDIQQQQANTQEFAAETNRNYPGLMNATGSVLNDGLKAIYRLFGMNKDDSATTTKVKE